VFSNFLPLRNHSALRKEAVSKESQTSEKELWATIPNVKGLDKAENLISLSHIAYDRGDYRCALVLCESAEDIYISNKEQTSSNQLMHVYEGITWSLKKLNRDAEAAAAALKAAKVLAEDDKSAAISLLREAGRCYFRAGEYEKSLECHRQIFVEADPNITDWLIASDYYNCGTANIELKKYADAVSDLLKARDSFKREKQPENVYICDEYLAHAYTELGNGVEAVIHGQKALDFALLAKKPSYESSARYYLGAAKVLLGEFEQAQALIDEALSINAHLADPDWELAIDAYKQLANLMIIKGQTTSAQEMLRRVKTLEETICDS
jgi:tetratricopeptide (TPR) repeat protein